MEYFCNFALKMSTITPTYCPHISQTRTRCPHTYGVRVCPCAAFATEPCRPTACISRAHSPAVPCPLPPVRWTFTFSAKERDSETGLSYFGSRYYSSDLSIWLSVDPMSDKYPGLSPYVYCANNPVKLVDPNGEEIDPESLSLWNVMRFSLNGEKKIAEICMQIEKETHGFLCKGASERYLAIDRTLTTMETMEVSSQMYKVSHCAGAVSSIKYNKKDNSITINFSNTPGFIHEITHCGQFEKGRIGFSRNNGLAFSDIYDELEAYTNQAWYDPTSIPFSAIFKPLTESWLMNIYDGEKFPYKKCGLVSTNRDSTMEDTQKAYPGENWSFNGTISSAYKKYLYFKPKQ